MQELRQLATAEDLKQAPEGKTALDALALEIAEDARLEAQRYARESIVPEGGE